MKTVFMFPGQGAQQVGMGKDIAERIPEIAELYRRANDIVGYDLASVCFDGPEDKLNSTEIAQPAIFVTSVACLAAMRAGRAGQAELADVEPEICTGLSLGEYTALYAAGVLGFEDALKLVQLRGRSMQEAANAQTGSMVSILGLDQTGVDRLCKAVLADTPSEEDGREPMLVPVNFNCPGQIVVSGTIKACDKAVQSAQQYGAIRAVRLQVAGAFHTQTMTPAVEKLGAALKKCTFSPFKYPVVANVDACLYDGIEAIPQKLLAQLVSAVRWQQSVEYLLDQGYERFIEIGPGRVLNGLVKKTCRAYKKKVTIINVSG